jgi:hypothetical protein
MISIPEVLEESNINWMIIRYGRLCRNQTGIRENNLHKWFLKPPIAVIGTNPETPEHLKALLS